ncbi:hypothetical protein Tco_0214881 [Tanacetum coccineum]
MRAVNGSISSQTHGCDRSSSSILNLFFFNVDFQCPLRCLHSRRAFLASGNMFSHGDVFWERIPSFPSRLCLDDSDLSRLILENTLARSGLPDTLREHPVLRPLRCSPLTFDVLVVATDDNAYHSTPGGLCQTQARSGFSRFAHSPSPPCYVQRTWVK